MAKWTPKQFWKDDDVYIIGGGSSLVSFDFNLLQDRKTIGCNSAFRLGPELCDLCVFGDYKFYLENKDDLESYSNEGGAVFTNVWDLWRLDDLPWVNAMPRLRQGLATDALGWNCNTGATAINLALILGAHRVYLLGYDMALTEGVNNWHIHGEKVRPEVFNKFKDGMSQVATALPNVFPGREVVNVSTVSKLDTFPRVPIEEHFQIEVQDQARRS